MTDRDDRQQKLSEDGGHLSEETLNAVVEFALNPAERAEAETHLATCASCQRLVGELAATASLLRGLPQPALRRSFQLTPEMAGQRDSIWLRLGAWLLPSLPALRTGTIAIALLLVAISARNAVVDTDGSEPVTDIPQAAVATQTSPPATEVAGSRNTAQLQTNQAEPASETLEGGFAAESEFALPESSNDQLLVEPTGIAASGAAGSSLAPEAKTSIGEADGTENEEAADPGIVGNDEIAADSADSAAPLAGGTAGGEAMAEGDEDASTMAMAAAASPEATSTIPPSPTATATATATSSPTLTPTATATVTPEPTVIPLTPATQSGEDTVWRTLQIALAVVFVALIILLGLLYRLRGTGPNQTS